MERKINNAIKRIRIASHIAERHGEVMVVCFSGGKDSQVMLDLVQRAGVPFHAVYSVTTIDHPMNVNFIRKNYQQVKFIHPKINFWDLCKKKKTLPTMFKRFCCEKLKETTFKAAVKAIGCRREESYKRLKYKVIANRGGVSVLSDNRLAGMGGLAVYRGQRASRQPVLRFRQ